MRQVQHAYDVGRHTAAEGGLPLLMATATDIGQDVLAQVLPTFHERHPHLPLRPTVMRSADQLDALRHRRLHLGWCWQPPEFPELVYRVVSREHYMIAVPDGHELADRTVVHLDELAGRPLVMWSRELNEWTYDRLVTAFAARGIPMVVAYTAMGLDHMAPLVLAGLGVGMTAATIARNKPVLGLRYVAVAEHEYVSERTLVWHRDERHPGVPLLVDLILERSASA